MKPVSIESTERFSRKLDNKKPYSIISDSNTFIDDEDERNLRRISYLRATKDDRMHVDSEGEEESNVPTTPKHR